ncbi:hypothetical protein Tco_1560880 [Tanacetum coccineum]
MMPPVLQKMKPPVLKKNEEAVVIKLFNHKRAPSNLKETMKMPDKKSKPVNTKETQNSQNHKPETRKKDFRSGKRKEAESSSVVHDRNEDTQTLGGCFDIVLVLLSEYYYCECIYVLEYWAGRGMLQILAYPDIYMERHALLLLKDIESYALLACGLIYVVLGQSPGVSLTSKELTHPFVPTKSSWKMSSNQVSNPKKEVTKLLDARLIYLISDSSWVSPVQIVLKKGGMTVVKNEKDELIPQWTVTRWHICIDYRKLNNATRKDHFPLPFIDQMLERLAGHEYYCFLDGFSGYFQIPIAPEDQDKTTFTCPYGTFAYR